MKITYISATPEDGQTEVILHILSDRPVAEALSSVLALFADEAKFAELRREAAAFEAERGIGGTGSSEAPVVLKNVIDEPKAEKVTRTRRPRTNPDAASAAETSAPAPVEDTSSGVGAPTEAGARRRTRVTAEPAQPEVKTITDADLAKAASSGAAQVGTEIISIILGELGVTTVSEIPTDRREWFLKQIDNEIAAAKEELAKAGK